MNPKQQQQQPRRLAMQPAGAFLKRCAGAQDASDLGLEADEELRAVEAGGSFEQELVALARLQQLQGPLQPAVAQTTDAGAAFLASIRRGLDDLARRDADESDGEAESDGDDDEDDESGYYHPTSGNTYYYVPDAKTGKAPASLDLSNTSTASASSGSFASSLAPCVSPPRPAEHELIFELEI